MGRIHRPSPALIVAVIALVIATVGTGFAAFKLPKNSVGTRQLKKNSVNGAKVKNHSLSGKDINLNKLGTVPNASHAGVADSATSLAPPEGVHLIGAPGEPQFMNGSANDPGEEGIKFNPAGFYKDHEGTVHLQGVVDVGGGGSAPRPIFTLPPGYRPPDDTVATLLAFCYPSGGGECETDDEGAAEVYTRLFVAGSSTPYKGTQLDGQVLVPVKGVAVSLDGITFRAAG
jgi:hypothetical protein